MKRRALIIGNMGIEGSERSRYIEGVQDDLVNFFKFIHSDNGGAWNRDEILFCKPNEINRTQLKLIILEERRKAEVDYWLIFFSGHGWADKNLESYLEVCPREKGDCDISLTELVHTVGHSRLLLITDACRAIPLMESGGKLPSYKFFSVADPEETEYRKACRKVYNDKIMLLPSDTVYIGYSCAFNQTSSDSGIYGGEYIHAVIESAKQCIVHEKSKKVGEQRFAIYAYPFVHSMAKQVVIKKSLGKQTPVYVGPKTWQPPFCVIP